MLVLWCTEPDIYDVHTEGYRGAGLEICHMFADSIVFKSIASHFHQKINEFFFRNWNLSGIKRYISVATCRKKLIEAIKY